MKRNLLELNTLTLNCNEQDRLRKTWKGKMIINILKWREEIDTYLTRVCKHSWSRKSPVKIEEITSFSQHCRFHQLMKATVLTENSYYCFYFHRTLFAPAMTTDASQVSISTLHFKIFLIKIDLGIFWTQ